MKRLKIPPRGKGVLRILYLPFRHFGEEFEKPASAAPIGKGRGETGGYFGGRSGAGPVDKRRDLSYNEFNKPDRAGGPASRRGWANRAES